MQNLEPLKQQLIAGNLPPAWIFYGDGGLQPVKELIAILLDLANIPEFHPNLLWIKCSEDKTEINLEDVAPIKGFLQQTPFYNKPRVIVIEDANTLNRQAANRLLKDIEEPPSKVYFFLLCSYLGSVLPTIRSRCCLLSVVEEVGSYAFNGSIMKWLTSNPILQRPSFLTSYDKKELLNFPEKLLVCLHYLIKNHPYQAQYWLEVWQKCHQLTLTSAKTHCDPLHIATALCHICSEPYKIGKLYG